REEGVAYAIGAGYDWRIGGALIGVSGEIGDVTGVTCATIDRPRQGPASPSIVGRGCASEGRAVFAGLRAGYVIDAKSLVYALGGYANVRASGRFKGEVDGSAIDASGHVDRDGFRVGAGVERSIGSHVALKAEYRLTAVGHDFAGQQHQIVSGLAVRF
ncbi:MAG: porin family protein, partial [Sphingomonas sp.]